MNKLNFSEPQTIHQSVASFEDDLGEQFIIRLESSDRSILDQNIQNFTVYLETESERSVPEKSSVLEPLTVLFTDESIPSLKIKIDAANIQGLNKKKLRFRLENRIEHIIDDIRPTTIKSDIHKYDFGQEALIEIQVYNGEADVRLDIFNKDNQPIGNVDRKTIKPEDKKVALKPPPSVSPQQYCRLTVKRIGNGYLKYELFGDYPIA